MGGRGGSSGMSASAGRKKMVAGFFENLVKGNTDEAFAGLQSLPLEVRKAEFTTNGNAVRLQEAVIESGSDKASVRFINQWNPIQVTKPEAAIRQRIEIVHYKNGNASAIYKLNEKSSKSLKNAEKNYHEMLDSWKKITHQKDIILK